jgi:hypothetical protein
MILRIIPFLLIIIPLVGFFYTPEPPHDAQALHNLVYALFTIPWWGKLLAILVGIIWISNGNEKK